MIIPELDTEPRRKETCVVFCLFPFSPIMLPGDGDSDETFLVGEDPASPVHRFRSNLIV
jgi:hypothetical protein